MPLDVVLGFVIQALTIAALLGKRFELAVSVVTFIGLMPINAVITLRFLDRWGFTRTELLRFCLNTPIALVANHLTHWPFPVWLWLPYVGLTYVPNRRLSWIFLSVYTLSTDVLAIHDGVRWIVPTAFTALAVMARMISDGRIAAVEESTRLASAQRERLEQAERELAKIHKLEAVGRLASGIAHEINTPLQFVSDSVTFLEEGVGELLADAPPDPEATRYLRENMPEALRLVRDGLARVTGIVASLREFAHPATQRGPLDVNHAVETALTVTKHEYKYVAEIERELGDVPRAFGNASEINQVLVNLLVNAAQAIAARRPDSGRGRIRVVTQREGDAVAITVDDDGIGIDESVRDKVFEPFFTTKTVGAGTGQGLAIARAIAERHGGSLAFTSKRGVGTQFVLRLPRAGTEAPSAGRAA